MILVLLHTAVFNLPLIDNTLCSNPPPHPLGGPAPERLTFSNCGPWRNLAEKP